MKDHTRAPLGQGSAFAMGLFFLYLGGQAFLDSIDAGALLFRVKFTELDGDLAGVLMATCIVAGGYLVASSYRQLRSRA
ncbi:hypothetical protein LVB87_15575 [Lysobacter sp. KIS68-7]|uniref:hypothetical protein n=1 Tax=Lysobacter sp. KIS68-7 TaxID=2904252 RepID=UPI001E3B7605|nr:hypothetical protein [Lysobacter sp. KIS68-7]UHQ19586.1 hypothetical protein LVB87_15575 [Lysobacter sp. KIS68-7]